MKVQSLKPMWLLRRRAGALLARAERDPSEANLEAIARWRDQDPRHSALLDSGSALLRQSVHLQAPSRYALRPPVPGLKASRPQFALAASIALALAVGGAIYVAMTASSRRLEAVFLTTRIGEIRQVPLKDGTRLTLDTGTQVRVEISTDHREATLEHGRARFAIAKDHAPFTIRTATAEVRLERGVIDVSSDSAGAQIDLITGSAQIVPQGRSGMEHLVLRAPVSLNTSEGVVHVVESGKLADWPTGRLTFSRTPLAEVVAASNRYTIHKIVVEEPAINNAKVTGVFKAGDAEALAKSLSAAFALRLERDSGGNLLLVSEPPKA